MQTEEITALLTCLTPEERAELDRLLSTGPIWAPNAGPQTLAYYSPADELFYGGQAGGGKTDLLLGLACTAHKRSILFRREFQQLKGVIDRSHELFDPADARWNGQDSIWRNLPGGRILEFGAMQYEDDKQKYKGRPHDLKAFDELPDFTESQYLFVCGWNRTTIATQRCRIVGAGNPPTNADGEWVIRRWGPWLDDQHPHPAKPGELRWYAVVDGKERAFENAKPFMWKDEEIRPRSRTFIPAGLKDNPYLLQTNYAAVLDSLPEPLRSQLKFGLFNLRVADNPWQVIPTEWIKAAQARWADQRPDAPLSQMGVDVSRGGEDKTVTAKRYGNWFAPLVKRPGAQVPDGPAAAGFVIIDLGTERAPVNVDVIGYGASCYDFLVRSGLDTEVYGVNFAARSSRADKSGKLKMRNVRAAAYWGFREALDPVTGDNLALPPDPELLADLAAPRWQLTPQGIQIEDKDEIHKRLGRSPDSGDAIVLAYYQEVPFFTNEQMRKYAQGQAVGDVPPELREYLEKSGVKLEVKRE